MRPASIFLIFLLLPGLCPLPARAVSREDLLVQLQAADMLGESIGGAVQQLPRQPRQARPTTQPAPAASYREIFDRTVVRLRKGEIPADESLNNLDNAQLFGEMTALQVYNLQQYARLTRDLAGATTLPAIETLLSRSKDPRWRQKRQQIHNAVTARIQQAAARRAAAEAAADATAPASPQPSATAGYSTLYDDPRWRPYYYGPGDALTGWNENFADPFLFQNGGGVYQRYDTRVNRDYDPRVGGDFDRRINIDFDRRTNIHVDPRQNY
jgi:hypothetical protein